MKPSDIEAMDVAEKLRAIEALWDALDDEDVESPEWHQGVLLERKQKIENGEAEFVSLEQLKGYLA